MSGAPDLCAASDCSTMGLPVKATQSRRMHRPFSADGFTLMEILVAIAVLAIALTVILQLFSGGLKSARISDAYTLGTFHAEEVMSEILLREALAPGVEEGRFEDGCRWRTEIVRLEQPEEDAKLPFDTFRITVQASWASDGADPGRYVELNTLKLVEKDKEGQVASTE